MRDSKRLHRKEPVRIGPRRSFAGLYGPSETPSTAPAFVENSHNGDGPRASAENSNPAASTVRTAYQVIEKYIEQGQAAAQQFSSQPYTSWMTGEGAQQLIDALLRVQYEVLPVWLEAVNNVMRKSTAAWPPAPLHPTPSSANGASSVALDINAETPTEVSVELRGLVAGMEPACPGARALEAGKPDITDIKIDSLQTPGPAKVSIRVPRDQPPGIYSGAIVDRKSGKVCGTISLRVADR